jgi:5'-nucleotidase
VDALDPLGEVWVVAPDREQSAASHAISLHRPLRISRVRERWYAVDGTPADCAYLAINHLMKENRPAVLVSGINHGHNLADDVTYSGTVAAAMEGLALGIPSIAISFAGGDLRADVSLLDGQIEVLTPLLAHLTSLPRFPDHTLLNVNLPPRRASEIRGVRLTRLGRRVYSDSLRPMEDPWGRKIFWIGGGSINWEASAEGSDFRAVDEGYVSVTPLHLDLTHRDMLEAAETWWREL